MIKILVSIVNFNSYSDTLRVIDCIENTIDLTGFEVNFIVVDNSSNKNGLNEFLGGVSRIRDFQLVESFDSIKDAGANYILSSDNNGFGAANNIVLDVAQNLGCFDAIWLLNNDLELDVKCLTSLSRYLVCDDYPILGSTIYEQHGAVTGTVNMAGFKGYGEPKNIDQLGDIYPVDAAIGTSMFVKPKFIKGIRFDERFFMYVEENDFCYRLKKIGVGSFIAKGSQVFHEGGKTFGGNQAIRWYYKVRNLLLFKQKNGAKNIMLVPFLLFVTLRCYPFSYKFMKAYACGVVDFLRGRFGRVERDF